MPLMKKCVALRTGLALTLAVGLVPVAPYALVAEAAEVGSSAQGGDVIARNEDVVEVSSFDSFKTALQGTGTSVSVKVVEDFSIDERLTINKNLVIDLNGHTVTATQELTVESANLTIRDTSHNESGKLTRNDRVINTKANQSATIIIESGTVEGTGWNPLIYVQKGSAFRMTGGVVKQTQTNVSSAVSLYYANAEITGGRIEGSIQGVNVGTGSSFTLGSQPIDEAQSSEEAAAVYVSGVYAGSSSVSINLQSGTVGKLVGSNFANGHTLNCWFETDVSDKLPAGMECNQVGEHYEVTVLTTENAAASINGTLYGSVVKAASELKEGQTLTLLNDYEGASDVVVKLWNATIDLNGHSITNTASEGVGIYVSSPSSIPAGNVGIEVINSSENPAVVNAATPVHVHSGNSLYLLPASISDHVVLEAAEGNTAIDLGTSSCVEYNASSASYITEGGFKATHADGKSYIHGSFSSAAENDTNHTAILLNDYDGMISTSREGIALVLDLNGHTVTYAYGSAIKLNISNGNLTIKNGTVVASQGTGAEVAIPATDGAPGAGIVPYHNTTLTLENVDLIAQGATESDYGIVTNGMSTGINVSLKGGSVTCENGIGIYFPCGSSSLTIEGTKISGTTGVAVKGGTVVVKGDAEINGNGTKHEASSTESGVTDTGDAIYLEGNYARDREVKIVIEGGSFVSANGNAVQLFKSDEPTQYPATMEVAGGSFDDDSIKDYLVTGKAVLVRANSSLETPYSVFDSENDALAAGGGYVVNIEGGNNNSFVFESKDACC